MIILPAIDLRGGKAVRLLRGEYDNMTVYGENPVAVAASFAEAGASNLHVVDLDGALSGNTDNMDMIKNIISETKMSVEVGGGIRNEERVYTYLSMGAERVILGTVAAENPAFAEEMVKKYGAHIAVGADVKNGEIATHGWTKTTGTDVHTFMKMMENMGVATVICTDVSRDGALMGTNMELYRELSEKYGIGIIASGGITTVNEVYELAKMNVFGAILGKAIYNGNIDLREAVKAEKI
ncbi:MAG: 1-(5-phosphoribosyl)-5-[Clostridia bacterium]|nr:1-(5-phosphoribosyl)-5-[(5-phosphoribosylamino)methylideneamino]imidazole-4-carboxamide isomerase [Clostridia bacterium]MBQ8861342.1 1-(5-phosphoribosyl)-5-[(5-phosphoribosylamino)methylideneamino]imidazole-4-carboxamide isomerase [Clostridia bacterium]